MVFPLQDWFDPQCHGGEPGQLIRQLLCEQQRPGKSSPKPPWESGTFRRVRSQPVGRQKEENFWSFDVFRVWTSYPIDGIGEGGWDAFQMLVCQSRFSSRDGSTKEPPPQNSVSTCPTRKCIRVAPRRLQRRGDTRECFKTSEQEKNMGFLLDVLWAESSFTEWPLLVHHANFAIWWSQGGKVVLDMYMHRILLKK